MELNSAAGNMAMEQEYYLMREDIEDLKQDSLQECGVNDGFYILKVDEHNNLTMKHSDGSNGYDTTMVVETLDNSNTQPKRTDTTNARFPFRCKHCHACFTHKKWLTSHAIYSHKNNKPVNANVIFCPMCSYLTIDQKFMDKHMLIHEEKAKNMHNKNKNGKIKEEIDAQYFCSKCPFRCKIEDTFKKHKELHDSLELYQLNKEKAMESNPGGSKNQISPRSLFKAKTLTVKHEIQPQVEITDVVDMQELELPGGSQDEENIHIISDIQLDALHATHFFKCKECEYTTNDIGQLQIHQKECHSPYRCQQCDVIFESNAHLKQHQQIHIHNFDCNLCGQEFELLKDLKAHHKVHANRNKYFYCSICGFMSFDEKEIRNHFPCLSENVCQKCKMKFKHPLSLKKHIEENHGTFQCDHCGYTIVDKKRDFINHVKMHEEDRNDSVIKEPFQYQCFECNRGFKVRNKLSEHLKTHGIFTCHLCDSSFFSMRDLKLHAFTHEEKITSYLCEQCGLECATKYDLSNHVLTHNLPQNNYQV